jgi:hypothetical protein
MTRSYVDAGVLIAAFRQHDLVGLHALRILSDPDRQFSSSAFARLEVLPKPLHFGRTDEVEFYQACFDKVSRWADPAGLVKLAYQQAAVRGLAAMNALHIAAAIMTGTEEFITTERPEKPIHRVMALRVISLHTA